MVRCYYHIADSDVEILPNDLKENVAEQLNLFEPIDEVDVTWIPVLRRVRIVKTPTQRVVSSD